MVFESFRKGFYLLNVRYICNLVIICTNFYWNIWEFIEVYFSCIPRLGLR